MTAYDGSIRINTRIDERGFNKGIRSLSASLKRFAAAVGIAFGIGAIVLFGKTAVSAASDLSSALVGLESVVSGSGKSFEAAQGFIEDYISDGLIPATNAITAYKNLALRGYDTSQIEKTLTILKDTAAFGRQSSLTLGDAVQSATEGLKNENSILVDNAGVTKNVAQMWKDYAESIGTTSNNLTKQQKIEAEIQGLMQESVYQTGDAAKLTETYAGKIAALSASFYNFKVAVGNIFIPILQKVIPVITQVINWLTVLANKAAQVVSMLLGVSLDASGMQSYADATEAAASATEDAEKAAKGALAAFDDLDVLQQDTSGTDSTSAGIDAGAIIPEDTGVIDDRLNTLQEKIATFKENVLVLFEPLQEPLARLKESALALGGTIWEGLQWAWVNILQPLGVWLITEAAPVFLDVLSGALDVLNSTLDALKPLGIWLWEEFLQPLVDWAGQAVIDSLGWLAEKLTTLSDWITEHQTAVQNIAIVLGALATGLILSSIGFSVATAAAGAFGAVMAFVTSPIFLVGLAIAAVIAIVLLLIRNWDAVKEAGGKAWDWIKNKWKDSGVWFEGIANKVKEAWRTALDWVGNKWETTFTGAKNFVKGVINSIIAFINSMINAVASGINAVIGGINSIHIEIPSWVPVVGGSYFGSNLPLVSFPNIPRLATGAVIPANSEFLAVLGDQKSGRNIEAPESLIRQIIKEELGSLGGDTVIDNVLKIDGEVLYRSQKKIERRRGKSLIKGAATA